MDRSQLTTIAVTAVVSVIAKEVVTWLIAAVKKTATTATTSAKLSVIFNKINFFILCDLLAITSYLGFLVYLGWLDRPLTTRSLFMVLGIMGLAIGVSIVLLGHLREAIRRLKSES
jgi:hypothetical protein